MERDINAAQVKTNVSKQRHICTETGQRNGRKREREEEREDREREGEERRKKRRGRGGDLW